MKQNSRLFVFSALFFCSTLALSQTRQSVPLTGGSIRLVNVVTKTENYLGKESLSVTGTAKGDEEQFVRISALFKNGVIEVDVAGKPGAGAAETARGFVGIAFRINNDNSKFECLYLRPTNGRAEDQERRNHAVQYVSFSDYPWFRLRKETPGKYESYADLVSGAWASMKIVIEGDHAKLFVNGVPQPTLVVNDLKLGPDQEGGIGLWVGPGTEAHFANLTITPQE
jgi:hypothetical protein